MIRKMLELLLRHRQDPDQGHMQEIYDRMLAKEYLNAGAKVGNAVSYAFMGECIGFDGMVEHWSRLERKYAARGYRTISLDDFISYGGYGRPVTHLVGKRRGDGEPAIYHADRFSESREATFSQPNPVARAFETGEVVTGTYFLPSTERDDDPK